MIKFLHVVQKTTTRSKSFIVEALDLDLEDLNQSKWKKRRKKGEIPTSFIKSFSPPPRAESKFWYTKFWFRETEKSEPGGDHYYVGCLGQTRV